MFEVAILAVIALAAVYWAAMWLIGRRDDVLYGSFVTPVPGSTGSETRQTELYRELSPDLPRRPRVARSIPAPKVVAPETPVMPQPRPAPSSNTASLQRSKPMDRIAPPARNEVLASLLETIKRDIGDAGRR